MVAALLAQRSRSPSTPAREDCSLAALVLGGVLRHEALATLLHGGLSDLMHHWHARPDFIADAVARLGAVIAPPAVFGSARMPAVTAAPDPLASTAFPLSSLLFGAVLVAG
jgi:hypothetical protein